MSIEKINSEQLFSRVSRFNNFIKDILQPQFRYMVHYRDEPENLLTNRFMIIGTDKNKFNLIFNQCGQGFQINQNKIKELNYNLLFPGKNNFKTLPELPDIESSQLDKDFYTNILDEMNKENNLSKSSKRLNLAALSVVENYK
jgi:hypothetical protein